MRYGNKELTVYRQDVPKIMKRQTAKDINKRFRELLCKFSENKSNEKLGFPGLSGQNFLIFNNIDERR